MTQTEKILKHLMKFLEQHADEITDEESKERLSQLFMDEYNAGIKAKCAKGAIPQDNGELVDADYYMGLAEEATSQKKRIEYLKKALELEPDNIDAEHRLILCNLGDKPQDCLEALQKLLQKETEHIGKEGYFKDAGEFWEILETRPYMRIRDSYFNYLILVGMIHRAIDEGNEMLRLCESDNLGIRYRLMHLYVYMEDELHAVTLHKRFDDYEETQMLLPLAILYYKLGDEEKAVKYLERLAAANKDTKKFLTDLAKKDMDTIIKNSIAVFSATGYRPASYDEFLIEMQECRFLFLSVPAFPQWAVKHFPKISKKQ